MHLQSVTVSAIRKLVFQLLCTVVLETLSLSPTPSILAGSDMIPPRRIVACSTVGGCK
jgi:hypothetical protein